MRSASFSTTGYRIFPMRLLQITCAFLLAGLAALLPPARTTAAAQSQPDPSAPRGLDQVLDVYVRDGLVYYRALKADRARLDAYVNSLASVAIERESSAAQIAFWLNAYNAIVLETVIDHYPTGARSKEYPAGSVRQISGAFERLTHRVAGRTVTLDQIEQQILPEFKDPRVYLALGRGAVGSGRLRSEAFGAESVDRQLNEVARECLTRAQCVEIDRGQNVVRLSSIFSWREAMFTSAFADKAAPLFASRSPIERAAMAFVAPHLTGGERVFIEENTFKVEYSTFDWSLNDLTGRGGR